MTQRCLIFVVIIGLLIPVSQSMADDYALIIGGVGGEKSFYEEFGRAVSQFHNLLIDAYGYAPEKITLLFEDEGLAPAGLVDARSTHDNVEQAFETLSQSVQPTDRFVLFMVGHANKADQGLKFNLPGRDIDETRYADLINGIGAQQTVLILSFPYSARMVPLLSREGRTIVTACSPREGYLRSGFGRIFTDAFSDVTADANADGDVSLLEAFHYAVGRVEKWYKDDGSVQSEHPHLDDNGDGIASRKDLPSEIEGIVAQETFLGKRRSPLATPAVASVSTNDTTSEQESEATEATGDTPPKPTYQYADDKVILPRATSNTPPAPTASLPYDFISEADEQEIQSVIDAARQADAHKDVNAVVLWESEELDINEDVSYVYSTRRVVKIVNEKGYRFGEVSIPYTRGSDDITIHHARTIMPDGEVVELDRRAIAKDIPPPSAVEAGLFVDARLMHFTMPKMSDGCIIDYAYSSNNRGHLMRGEFWRQVYFQASAPVKSYRFRVHAPKKKTLYYYVHGLPLTPETTEASYTRTYTFRANDVPPLLEEAFMPSIEDLAYNISISSLNSWDALMQWYATLIREQDHASPEIEKKTKELISGAWSRREKIQRLYEYVAQNINYVGIELGIWAIKPRSAPSILANGYGDCKDKSTLLSTMLEVAGIKSYPALISAGESGKVVRDIPSLAYFNHMILAVEENENGDLLWLDPTAETCAFGDLPASDQGRWTLVVNPDYLTAQSTDKGGLGGQLYKFIESPTAPPERNLRRVVTQIDVDADLSVKVTQDITLTGEFNTRLRSKLKYINPEARSAFLHDYMELDDRAKLEAFEIPKLDDAGDTLKIRLSWRCADYLFAIGRQYILELPINEHPYAELLSEDKRAYTVVLGKTLTLEEEVAVNLPAPFVVDSLPQDVALENNTGAFTLKGEKSKRKIQMKQRVRLNRPTVDVEQVDALKEIVKQASSKGTRRVMIIQQ